MSKVIRIFYFFLCLGFYSEAQSIDEIDLNDLPEEFKEEIIKKYSLTDDGSDNVIIEDSFIINETQINDNLKSSSDKRFGFSFFDYSSTTNTPVLDIPLPSDYVLSINDQLELLLTGNNKGLIPLRVDLAGNINIPDVGSISIVNLPLDIAQQKVRQVVSDSLIGTNSYLSIKEASLKKISVIGAVNKPGTYLVNPFLTIYEAIKYANGLENEASLRNIRVIDASGNESKYDLYQFLIFGDKDSNPSLQNGDTLIIPAAIGFTEIVGAVNRPMSYEYLYDDKAGDLIKFALGTKQNADLTKIFLNSLDSNTKEITTKNINQMHKINSYTESIFVGFKSYTPQLQAYVKGNLSASGYYEYEINTTLEDFLKTISFDENLYPFYMILKQTSEDGKSRKIYYFNYTDKDRLRSIKLLRNIEIITFSREDVETYMENENYLNELYSEDSNEGNISDFLDQRKDNDVLFKNLNSRHLIGLNSYEQNVKLPVVGKINLNQFINFFPATGDDDYLAKVLKDEGVFELSEINNDINSDEIITISISDKVNLLRSVEIDGEINFPGIYTVSNSTTLSEIFSLAGGLTDNANKNAIYLSRRSIKSLQQQQYLKAKDNVIDGLISNVRGSEQGNLVDISFLNYIDEQSSEQFPGRVNGDLYPEGSLAKSLVLEDGDKIIIPPIQNLVFVVGEVFISSALEYKETNFEYYIKSSGGYKQNADKRNVFIIKPNGEVIKDIGGYKVQPGDTINVPRDLNKIQPLPLISLLSGVFSDIALAAASLNILRN